MKNKVFIGVLSGLIVLGGAIAVGASKNDSLPDDSIHADDKTSFINLDTKNLPELKEDSSSSQSQNTSAISVEEAAKIATNKVSGKVTEIEKEMEHGRLEYKFEIQSDRGEADVRVDAETGKITRVEFDDDNDDDDDDDKGRSSDDDGSEG